MAVVVGLSPKDSRESSRKIADPIPSPVRFGCTIAATLPTYRGRDAGLVGRVVWLLGVGSGIPKNSHEAFVSNSVPDEVNLSTQSRAYRRIAGER